MRLLLRLAAVTLVATFSAQAAKAPRTLSRAELLDRIRGGWAGQMIGVAFGAKTEFRSNGKIGDWDLPWTAGMLENAIQQDDLYVEMTFAKVMDTVGLNATSRDYGHAFRDSQYHLWHANAAARRALALGIEAPSSGHPKYNIHANDIDFQIEADFIGLMTPGLPRVSNRLCDRVGRVMNYGDGLYGGMFVCGMYSAAFFSNSPREIVQAGLACIPANSEYGLLVADLLRWSAEHPSDWRRVWQLVQDKWDRHDPCPDGALEPFNIDAKLNGAYIAFGLLFGDGDFRKTMEISTRCGQDSDCNPSSAAGVLGVMLGYQRIPQEFVADLPALASRKFAFTDYSFDDIVRSTEVRALAAIRKAGGKVTDTRVEIPHQTPRAPRLEQWSPGIPMRRVPVSDPSWRWEGDWAVEEGTRVANTAGNKATFTFAGVGVAILARLDQAGGRADVLVDGRKVRHADAFIPERTHDNCLWHIDGLKPGTHTVTFVTRGDSDPRSKGHRIALSSAVVYRAP